MGLAHVFRAPVCVDARRKGMLSCCVHSGVPCPCPVSLPSPVINLPQLPLPCAGAHRGGRHQRAQCPGTGPPTPHPAAPPSSRCRRAPPSPAACVQRAQWRRPSCAPPFTYTPPCFPSFPLQARAAIDGRMFAGSTVEAAFMQAQEFMEAITPPPTDPAAAAAALAAVVAADAAAAGAPLVAVPPPVM